MAASNFFDRYFKLTERGTNVKTEVLAGLVTFLSCVSIVVLNPMILTMAGMDHKAVFWATALSCCISCLWMGIWGNLPFALGPAMGLNSYMVFYLVKTLGLSWQNGLACCFTSGCIFMLLGLFGVQQKIVDSIPECIKKAIGPGVGFFLAFIGFQSAGIVVDSPDTLLTLGDLSNPGTILSILGIAITAVLIIKNVKGGILLGIVAITIIGLFVTNPATGTKYTMLPESFLVFENPVTALAPTFGKLSYSGMFSGGVAVAMGSLFGIISFLFVDLFDSLGVLLGVLPKVELKEVKTGRFNEVGRAMFVSAGGAAIGAVIGTSTVSIYGAESTTGIAEGGRTGLTACVTGLLFLLTLFISPLFLMIPACATAPALIIVGIFMMGPLGTMDLSDFTIAMPVFFSIIIMPFTYNIAYGLMFSIISFVIAQVAVGNMKKIKPMVWILFVLFIFYFYVSAIL